MGFPQKIAEKVLVDCGRSCSLCHKFCGFKIQLHHIVQKADGGEDTYDNCISLCLSCHAEIKAYDPRHPIGKKYTESELKAHRDKWYKSVAISPALRSNDDYIESDRTVYYKLKELIDNDVMNYIREMDFGCWSYGFNQFDDLHLFCDKCLEPLLQFIDADLEKSKMSLRESLQQLFLVTSDYCYCEDKHYRIPSDWELEKTELYEKATEELNRLSWDVWNEYYNFITLIKRKLVV